MNTQSKLHMIEVDDEYCFAIIEDLGHAEEHLNNHWLTKYDEEVHLTDFRQLIKDKKDAMIKFKEKRLEEKFKSPKHNYFKKLKSYQHEIEKFEAKDDVSLQEATTMSNIYGEYNALAQQYRQHDGLDKIRIELYPHPVDFRLCHETYMKEGLINSGISKTAKAVIQPNYTIATGDNEGAKKYLDEWVSNEIINFYSYLYNCQIDWAIYGNMFTEPVTIGNNITKLKQLRPEYMYVDIDATGHVYGYWELGEYRINYYTYDEIIHWKREARGMPYGYGMVYPSMQMIKRKLDLWNDIIKVIHRYGNPIVVWTFGNELKQRIPKEMVGNFMQELRKITPKSDIAVPFGISGDVLNTEKAIIDFTMYLQELRFEIMAPMQIPSVVFGDVGGRGAGAIAQTQLEAWDKDNQTRQYFLANEVMIPIFKRALGVKKLGQRKTDLKVRWNRFNRIERDKQEQNLVKLKESGIVTPGQARQILGMDEKIEYKDPATDKVDKDYYKYAHPRESGSSSLGIKAPGFETAKSKPKPEAGKSTKPKK